MLAAAVTMLTLPFAAACDSGGNSAPPPSPAAGADAATVEIEATGRRFVPDQIRVNAGVTTTIRLRNSDGERHTITVYLASTPEGPVVADTGEVAPLDSGETSVLFTAGEHAFRCEIHPDIMRGVIAVAE